MLVLTRKVGEEIVIEGNGRTVIRIVHLSTDGSQVKIGFSAPREINIQRAELLLRMAFRASSAGQTVTPLPSFVTNPSQANLG